MLTKEQTDAVNELHAVNSQMNVLKGRQEELRKKIGEELFPNIGKGTNRVDLGTGWKLKAVVTEKFSLDKGENGDYAPVKSLSEDLESHILDALISWKPSLSSSAYRMLTEADKKVVDSVLTTQLSNPTFTFEEPKQKKEE